MSKNLFIFSLLLVLIIGIASADDIPLKPHEFYGTVTINGAPAPVGTSIIAKMWGTSHGTFTTVSSGTYGGPGPFDSRLMVQVGTREYNDCCVACGCSLQVEFYINGVKAQVYDVTAGSGWSGSYTFQPETSTRLNLNTGTLPGPTSSPQPTPATTQTPGPTASPYRPPGHPLLSRPRP